MDLDFDMIRKLASLETGRQYLQEEAGMSTLEELEISKMASAADPMLLKIASRLPGNTLEVYEALGGKYVG